MEARQQVNQFDAIYGGSGVYERGEKYRIVGGLSPEGLPDASARMIMIEGSGSTDLFVNSDNYISRNDQGGSKDGRRIQPEDSTSRIRHETAGDGDDDEEQYYSGAEVADNNVRGSGSNEALAGSISAGTGTASAGRSHRSQLTELGDTMDQQPQQQQQPSSTRESSVINLYALNTTAAVLETENNNNNNNNQ